MGTLMDVDYHLRCADRCNPRCGYGVLRSASTRWSRADERLRTAASVARFEAGREVCIYLLAALVVFFSFIPGRYWVNPCYEKDFLREVLFSCYFRAAMEDGGEWKINEFSKFCRRVKRPIPYSPFSIFNSPFMILHRGEYALHGCSRVVAVCSPSSRDQVVLIVLHRHDGLPRYPEQLYCHVLLPQAARPRRSLNVVLHLQRQNFHIKSANITTGMKIRFTISPASAL